MSRHVIQSGLTYGFDHALGYWYTQYDRETGEVKSEGDSRSGMSRSDFIGVLQEHNAPEEHCTSVALDLPF